MTTIIRDDDVYKNLIDYSTSTNFCCQQRPLPHGSSFSSFYLKRLFLKGSRDLSSETFRRCYVLYILLNVIVRENRAVNPTAVLKIRLDENRVREDRAYIGRREDVRHG